MLLERIFWVFDRISYLGGLLAGITAIVVFCRTLFEPSKKKGVE